MLWPVWITLTQPFNSPESHLPHHHEALHRIKNTTTVNTGEILVTEMHQWKGLDDTAPLCCFGFHAAGHFEALFWMWLLCVLCVWTMILARCACGLWEYKYRAGCIGHDQSIQAGNSEGSPDIIKRKTLELQWSWYGLQNGDGSTQWNV